MSRGICSKCNSLIEIDPKESSLECPNCHEQIFTETAMKNFARAVTMYNKKGEVALLGSTNYPEAYKNYSQLLKLMEKDLGALINTTIARLYCSTLHEIHLKEATDILLNGSDKVEISQDNVAFLSDSLSRIRFDAKKLVDAFKQVKSESNYALNLYHQALNEYIYYLKAYLDIYDAMGELNKYFKESKELLNDEINESQKALNENVTIKNQISEKHDFYDTKHNVISDIYPNMKKMYKARMILYGVMGLGAILAIIGFIFLGMKMNPILTYLILGFGLAFFIGGYFIAHHLRSKNYHLNY